MMLSPGTYRLAGFSIKPPPPPTPQRVNSDKSIASAMA